MSWMPVWSKSCIKCAPRVAQGELPYCVKCCPNGALSFGAEARSRIEQARSAGGRIFELPAWENSKDGIVYAR